MSQFLEAWMRGIGTVLLVVLGLCAFTGGCMAMVAAPSAAFIIPLENIEPRWLGAAIGTVCMLIVFGGIFALLDDT